MIVLTYNMSDRGMSVHVSLLFIAFVFVGACDSFIIFLLRGVRQTCIKLVDFNH